MELPITPGGVGTPLHKGECLMAPATECRHIMHSGLNCKSPAMRGATFCYYHGRPARPTSPGRSIETCIQLPAVGSPQDNIDTINEIVQALAHNLISSRRAAILLQAVQMASSHIAPAPGGLDVTLQELLRQGYRLPSQQPDKYFAPPRSSSEPPLRPESS